MKIAVCEDNAEDRALVCTFLEDAMASQGVEAGLCAFESAEELLAACKKTHFSIFFLDILLPGTSGMDAALRLRRAGNPAPIVFITVTKDYLAQSNSVWAADYLVKPVAAQGVAEALARCVKQLAHAEPSLTFTLARHPEAVPYSDILYLEGDNRNCVIHTTTGRQNPYLFIGAAWEILRADPRFCHCHRRFIVNLDHALLVRQDGVAMRDDAVVPIRRGDVKRVRLAWENRRLALARGRQAP